MSRPALLGFPLSLGHLVLHHGLELFPELLCADVRSAGEAVSSHILLNEPRCSDIMEATYDGISGTACRMPWIVRVKDY
jgi:hypothetical protein